MFWSSVIFLCLAVEGFDCLPASPIGPNEVSNFVDDWDYRLEPHSEPLLNISSTNHELPPPPKVHNIQVLVKKKRKPKLPKKMGNAVYSVIKCNWCHIGVSLFMDEIKKGSPSDTLKTKIAKMCVEFNLSTEEVCSGLIDVFGPTVLAAAKKTELNVQQICSLALGETCGEKIDNPLHQWDVKFPDTVKPPVKRLSTPKMGSPTLKVLHLTDTHLDPDYTEGTVSNCNEPLCCRNDSTEGIPDVVTAGKWGAYAKCDSPKILIDHMLKHINEQHPDIDFILWTGDLPPHDIWRQTKESNLAIIKETTKQMLEYFPTKPIFPAVGNHESIPAGTFAPPWVEGENSTAWLFNELANHWKRWLPEYSTTTVMRGAFYSVLLRPKLRLISMNTNYCHTYNWWLLVNSTDPAKELQWLIHELQQAENKQERVLLIGHIPPGVHDCMKVWSENFYSIVARYENTIIAQFYGHTHADEFQMFYDPKDLSRPVNVAYLGPSVTTFENHNPAYRVYYLDGDYPDSTRAILDHETWTMNLEEANKNGDPEWYRLYSARRDLDIETLNPEDWNSYLKKLIDVPDAFYQFYKYYYRDSPARPKCDNKCKLQILCDLRSGKSQSRHLLCHDLEEKFGG
ncbi:sphingomyelin phosphodiesterase-like isoform X2 [Coccinella septempunctata]|uniref:sphingomyelin phosphodiesterase-like isoform X2 n=1 Tax=Coccinella septempunctata TaxID=41139 RepID=UPI001D06D7BA|nr:sphingomyelin phosphodiesterase-like isoform X2 [Coccinella septempunctata]